MSAADVEVVNQFLKAFQAGDVEAAFARIHPEVVVHEGAGLPYAGEWVGHEGLGALVGKIMENMEMTLEGFEVIDGGSSVVVKLNMMFTSRTTGRKLPMPGVEVYSVKDGLVSAIDVYYKDTKGIADLAASG